MNTNLVRKAKRNPEVVFYDVTNFYYETEDPDDDEPDFKCKSRIMRRKIKDENGDTREITEKVVVHWSRNYENRAIKENKSFLAFLDKFLESPTSFPITATQAKSLRKFLGKKLVNEKTGEVLNSSELKALIDYDKVDAYKKSFGFYQLVTSELTMPEKEVIDKYHGLSQIENQFRLMKGDLSTRPLFVWSPEHIKAHLLICMIALTVMRIIQNRVVKSAPRRQRGRKGRLMDYGA